VDPDPDPDWIRIQRGPWIWIRIRIRNPDPDPGARKWTLKFFYIFYFCLKALSCIVGTVVKK